MNTYRQQLDRVTEKLLKKVEVLMDDVNKVAVNMEEPLDRLTCSYAKSARMLVEAFLLRKYGYLEAVVQEGDKKTKDALRHYCYLVDDLAQDLTKLLMQLQLRIEVNEPFQIILFRDRVPEIWEFGEILFRAYVALT